MLIDYRFSEYDQQCSNDSLALVFCSRPIKMSPRFVLGRENVPCVAKVVNRLLKMIVQTLNVVSQDPQYVASAC